MLWPACSTSLLLLQVQVASGYSQGGLGRILCQLKVPQRKSPSECDSSDNSGRHLGPQMPEVPWATALNERMTGHV